MRKVLTALSAVALFGAAAAPALAVDQAAPAAAPAKAKYSTTDTEIGTLLDDPAAKAIVEKYLPGMTTSDEVDMARAMTLKAVQAYAPEQMTDETLAKIDAEFAQLK